MARPDFDIIINGGGMVGLAIAAALPENIKIAILDPQPWFGVEELENQPDPRVSAISPASEKFLTQVGAWQKLNTNTLCPYNTMCVWDFNGTTELTFTAQQVAKPHLGHIIENTRIRAALYEVCAEKTNIELINKELTHFSSNENRVNVDLVEAKSISAQLLLGADGARSKTRELMATKIVSSDYKQLALVSVIESEKPHEYTAWQRFLPTGPIAMLPLYNQNQCAMVWSLEKDKAQQVLESDDVDQLNRIALAFDSRLGSIKFASKLWHFPLIARHTTSYLDHRVALLGDAAHSIHPLAGQGVNLGFADAACLAECLTKAKEKEIDLATLRYLREYERERKGENLLMEKAMTGLNWLYHQENPAMVMLRNTGVSLVQNIQPLKRQFIKRAMGL